MSATNPFFLGVGVLPQQNKNSPVNIPSNSLNSTTIPSSSSSSSSSSSYVPQPYVPQPYVPQPYSSDSQNSSVTMSRAEMEEIQETYVYNALLDTVSKLKSPLDGVDIDTDSKVKIAVYFKKVRVQIEASQIALAQLEGIDMTGISRLVRKVFSYFWQLIIKQEQFHFKRIQKIYY
jgi:hypothetical protein